MADLHLLFTRHDRPINYTQFPDIPTLKSQCNLKICPLQFAFVDYVPSLAGNLLFAVLFAVYVFPQLYFAIRHRTIGFGIAILSGVALEIIGYIARIMMHHDPFSRGAFLMYLICLTIAPVFLAAGIYLCLGRIVIVYDPEEKFSLIKSRTYIYIFCACDLFSLVLQSIGGAKAAESVYGTPQLQTGVDIMVAGLSIQVVSLLLFAGFCVDFGLRVNKQKGALNPKHQALYQKSQFRFFLIALGFATLFIFIRSVFRVAELSGGFGGALANNQVSFMVLDGAMVIMACFLLTVYHPGRVFRGSWQEANWNFRTAKAGDRSSSSDEVEVTKGKKGIFGRRSEKEPVVQERGADA